MSLGCTSTVALSDRVAARSLVGLLLCLGSRFGLAMDQRPEDLFGLSPAELSEISVVSASLAPQRLADSPASVTLITAEQIKQMGARDLYDVLRHVPGLRVDRTNRGRPVISVRGVHRDTSSQVLFLLDGHALNEPANGSATFLFELSNVPLESIDRIEVLRGPGSAMYGSNAFLGVVSILTRTANGFEGSELSLRTEFESDGHIASSANLLYGHAFTPDRTLNLNVNLLDHAGARIPVEADINGRSGHADTRFEQLDVQLHGTLGPFTLKGRYTDQDRGEYHGALYQLSPDDRLKAKGGFVELYGRFDTGRYSRLLVRTYFDYNEGESLIYSYPRGTIAPSSPFYAFNATGRATRLELSTSKAGVELRGTYTGFSSHEITYGLLWEYQAQDDLKTFTNDIGTGGPVAPMVDVSETNNFGRDANRTLVAPYIEDIWKVTERLTANASLRMDYYSDFGETLNPRLGLTWQFHPDYSLRLLYGTAFRAPDFRGLFLKSPYIKGNSDLSEEEVRTFELGLTARPLDGLHASITAFHSELDQLINVPAGETQIQNIDSQTSSGIELEARYQWRNGGYIELSYTYVDAKLEDGHATPDEPRNSGSLIAWTPLTARIGAGVSLYWQDASPRAPEDSRSDLAGYAVVDLNLTATLTKSVELRLGIYNLFDRDYAYPAPAYTIQDDYQAPGRSFLAQLRIAF